MRAAHPRSRGENAQGHILTRSFEGSSPLTRGKPIGRMIVGARQGLIPAHAGKTMCDTCAYYLLRAHPRSRGENVETVNDCPTVSGSSPLTRGKLLQAEGHALVAGLIPAHAGKTARARARIASIGAHPRSRGENTTASIAASTLGGSSPLTRGKPTPEPRVTTEPGLIPAHAGKTRFRRRRMRSPRAHPRSRGENRVVAVVEDRGLGSSPLTRGKPGGSGKPIRCAGLIPAHAGKTRSGSTPANSRVAHPRSRGENHEAALAGWDRKGSSPLTRGKHDSHFRLPSRRGLIPAHAGKTSGPSYRVIRPWAHPRSRGENP